MVEKNISTCKFGMRTAFQHYILLLYICSDVSSQEIISKFVSSGPVIKKLKINMWEGQWK
jgi:hypothetical protein